MNYSEQIIGNVAVLIVNVERGTIKHVDKFKEHLISITDKGYFNIVIDLTKCKFIDSSFLGVLVSFLKRTARINGDLKLVGFQPAVRSMFEITRMFRVFDTFSNISDAVKSFK